MARRTKYTEDLVKIIERALQNGNGRVRAVKAAGIDYQTFINWMDDESKADFSRRIKKAEKTGNNKIKDMCKRRIIEDTHWQSAAWWLERNFPEEFRNKNFTEHSGEIKQGATIKFIKSGDDNDNET
jgi:hypothetical protein